MSNFKLFSSLGVADVFRNFVGNFPFTFHICETLVIRKFELQSSVNCVTLS